MKKKTRPNETKVGLRKKPKLLSGAVGGPEGRRKSLDLKAITELGWSWKAGDKAS